MTVTTGEKSSTPTKALAFLASLVAAVLLALAALKLFFAIVTPLQAAKTSGAINLPASAELAADLSILTRADLFTKQADVQAQPTDEILPETNLRLILKSASPTPGGVSGAVIQLASGDQQYFREGEEIMRGVTLTRVETWRVVITRNGVREALTLKNRPDRDNANEPLSVLAGDPAEGSVAAQVQIPDNIDELGAEATIRSLAGPLLPQLELAGFQGDDVPVAIDGKPIPADSSGMQAVLARARIAGAVTVTVSRDGRPTDIRFTLP
ncbi:MAG: hypothetical protein HRU11_07510 [Parvularculaceae bacterium]|nr:hypothetical protein [Parvularculaceae bacterium]